MEGIFISKSPFLIIRIHIESLDHRYATSLAPGANVRGVPSRARAAYDDAWAALRRVALSSSDAWLTDPADLRRVFLAGDSTGGNIAFHTAVRAGRESAAMDIEGVVLVHPYF